MGSQVFQKQEIRRIWEVMQMIKAISQKYQNKEVMPTEVLLKLRDKFKEIFNSPSGFVPWQNERVQC